MLYIVRGIPGSGKSTYVSKFKTDTNAHFEVDMFFEQNPEQEYQFDKNKLHQAHLWCQDEVRKAIREGKDVWVSNTFMTFKEVKEYIEIAVEEGVQYSIQSLDTYYGSIHDVPVETIDRMQRRFTPHREFVGMCLNYYKKMCEEKYR